MAKPQNIVGEQVRKLRYEQGLTQEMLAARCEILGLEMSRATLSSVVPSRWIEYVLRNGGALRPTQKS